MDDRRECPACEGAGRVVDLSRRKVRRLRCTSCNGAGFVDLGPRSEPPLTLEHVASADCWCQPEVDYVDPATNAAVYVHRSVQ